jgi:hypothetical protein
VSIYIHFIASVRVWILYIIKHAGVENLEAAIDAIKTSITSEGGELNVKMKVRILMQCLIPNLVLNNTAAQSRF